MDETQQQEFSEEEVKFLLDASHTAEDLRKKTEHWANRLRELGESLPEKQTENSEIIDAHSFTLKTFKTLSILTINMLRIAGSKGITGKRMENLQRRTENFHLRAIQTLQRCLQVLTRDTFPYEWIATQRYLALLYTHPVLGQYDRAAEHLEEAYQFLLEAKIDLAILADVMFELAQLDHTRGRLDRSMLLLKDARRLYQRLGKPTQEIAALATLGNLELQAGQLDRAAEHLQSALAFYQAEGRPERIAEVEKLLGFLAPF